jgi:hypothetical protein
MVGEREAADLRRALKAILAEHVGAGRAITGARLARRLGQRNDRKIRMVIQALVEDGEPIAASTSEPAGYYVLATRDEAEAYVATLRSRAQWTFKRLRDFQRAVEARFGVPYQPLLLDLDGGSEKR